MLVTAAAAAAAAAAAVVPIHPKVNAVLHLSL